MIRLFHTKIGFYRIYPSGFYVDPKILQRFPHLGSVWKLRFLHTRIIFEVKKVILLLLNNLGLIFSFIM